MLMLLNIWVSLWYNWDSHFLIGNLTMFTINPVILRTPIADKGILLLEPTTGKYFELNDTSVLIYQCLEKETDIHNIVETLVNTFDIDAQTAQTDVQDLITQFVQNNICIET